MLLFPPIAMFLALGVCLTPASVAEEPATHSWIDSGSLDLHPLSAQERRRVVSITESKTIGYEARDTDVPWRIHRGDLTIPGHLDNTQALVVDGNLRIEGTYDDDASDIGFLIVLGDFEAEHVFSWHGFYVQGAVRAKGLVYGTYNDYAFEVDGGVSARGIVMDDHSSDYAVTRAEFDLDGFNWPEEAHMVSALRHLVPDLLTDPDRLELDEDSDLYNLWPSYDAAKALAGAGQPLFRETPAGPAMIAALRVALASDSGDEDLLAILGRDPLIDRTVAARPELGEPVIDALLELDDPGVRAWVSGKVTDLTRLGGAGQLTPRLAEQLVENPRTPEKTLLEIARSADVAVRRTLAQRGDRPRSVLSLLARDADSVVRASAVGRRDSVRLPAEDQARLAGDPEVDVRRAVARDDLPFEVASRLAKDASSEVRLALAETLAYRLDQPRSALSLEQRQQLAETLARDSDREVAHAAFVALPAARQVEAWRKQTKGLPWDGIAEATRSVELMRALLAGQENLEILGGLAKNLALPVELQLELVERAGGPPVSCDACWLHETLDDVVDSLVQNDNAAPRALVEVCRLAARRPGATFINSLTGNRTVPLAGLQLLDKAGGVEDWSLSVLLMQHATREMLEWALPAWYEEAEVRRAVRGLRKRSGADWWRALAQSEISELREAAATNVNTPGEVLVGLVGDASEEVGWTACGNPNLPPAAREAAKQRGFDCLLAGPLLSLEELAELSRSAATSDEREAAAEAHTLRRLRAW